MASVNYLYRSTKPVGPLTIRLLFRNNNVDEVFAARTRCIVPKEYWEKHHNSKRLKEAKMKSLKVKVDRELYELETHILESFHATSFELLDKNWLISTVDAFYRPQLENNLSNTPLLEYIDSYIRFKGSDLANSTIKKYGVVKGMLSKYETFIGKKLHINQIDLSFKQGFETYCLDDGYAINTIAKALKIVKTVCNHARKRGLDVSPELEEIKLKSVEAETLFLNLEELEKIEDLKGLPEYLDNARDWLLISCYTGQRVSDFMRFKPSMITATTNKSDKEVFLLEFNQLKTNSPITIPLNQKVMKILNKRNGNFPRKIADQPYNRFIKEVCKLAGLTNKVYGSKKVLVDKLSKKWRKKADNYEKWELVTSHIGRRTFATNNYNSIPTTFLAYATGHKNEKTFLTYMRKNNKDMALELSEYFT
ncbi:phage integrase SAM-like domain-containing protein [Eudoraea chungangensis]|uniref:phage integrase SAM-like domain-containing protein n=1 Tax=Eudoraea chungangensis TaxID=1481905 RepID=UPI0023EBC039|nr:phage integrase SAM-like domain-containing protein [Eudoraea chungangensis]